MTHEDLKPLRRFWSAMLIISALQIVYIVVTLLGIKP